MFGSWVGSWKATWIPPRSYSPRAKKQRSKQPWILSFSLAGAEIVVPRYVFHWHVSNIVLHYDCGILWHWRLSKLKTQMGSLHSVHLKEKIRRKGIEKTLIHWSSLHPVERSSPLCRRRAQEHKEHNRQHNRHRRVTATPSAPLVLVIWHNSGLCHHATCPFLGF